MKINLINPNYKYGFHVSKLPTFTQTIMHVLTKTPFSAFQVYSSNRSSMSGEIKYNIQDLIYSGELLKNWGVYMCFHANLLYNLAGKANPESEGQRKHILENMIRHFIRELDMGVVLGCGSVVHIGASHDRKAGIKTVAYAIEELLTRETLDTEEMAKAMNITLDEFITKRKIILENSAGEGTKLGGTLEEIAEIINLCPEHLHPQIKVCIDTAHSYGAGLCDWSKPENVEEFYERFDNIIGLDHLEVFHLNDSRKSEKKANDAYFNSKKDRHENLGLGYIFGGDGNFGLIRFFELARKYNKNIIGEPPHKSDDGSPAPGGKWDWKVVKTLLSDNEYPLLADN